MARNRFGWSDYSQLFSFVTGRKGNQKSTIIRQKNECNSANNEPLIAEKANTEEKLNTGSQQLNANLHILAPHTAAAASTVRLAHPALMLLLVLCFIPRQWDLMFSWRDMATRHVSLVFLAIIEMNTHSEYAGQASNFRIPKTVDVENWKKIYSPVS